MPSCPRCGNEEDLVEWLDGRIYCSSCIRCGHNENPFEAVCLECLRQLHSMITFEGPRIVDITYYVHEAWREYSVNPSDLMVWTFAEEGLLNEFIASSQRLTRSFGTTAPPPHHRFA